MSVPVTFVDSLFGDAPRLVRELPLFRSPVAGDRPGGNVESIPLPQLVTVRPSDERDDLLARLKSFDPISLSPSRGNATAATALRAGLFLWHDYADESHSHAQSIEGEGAYRLGDYWHAILHRREPDYANARYWFRRVGPQSIFAELYSRSAVILSECPSPEAARWRERWTKQGAWDSFAFVELCEACADDEERELALAARRIQLVEMALLLEFTRAQV